MQFSCGEKLSPKVHLWRKNDKYEVWSPMGQSCLYFKMFFCIDDIPRYCSLVIFILFNANVQTWNLSNILHEQDSQIVQYYPRKRENVNFVYTSAACDACEKFHVCQLRRQCQRHQCQRHRCILHRHRPSKSPSLVQVVSREGGS